MKQKRLVSMIGMLVVLFGTLFMMIGCPTGQEPQKEKPVEQKKSFVIKYDLIDCDYVDFKYADHWKPAEQWVKDNG